MDYPAIMRSRYSRAKIPVRLQGFLADHSLVSELVDTSNPPGRIRNYLKSFREGDILRAVGKYKTCGRGLWIVGGEEADVIAAAILQSLILDQTIESGFYVNVHDLVEAESPTGESFGDNLFSDLLVLQGPGDQHQSASGWSDNIIFGLLRRRYDRGLPTIVSTPWPAGKTLPSGFAKQAFSVVGVRGTDVKE